MTRERIVRMIQFACRLPAPWDVDVVLLARDLLACMDERDEARAEVERQQAMLQLGNRVLRACMQERDEARDQGEAARTLLAIYDRDPAASDGPEADAAWAKLRETVWAKLRETLGDHEDR